MSGGNGRELGLGAVDEHGSMGQDLEGELADKCGSDQDGQHCQQSVSGPPRVDEQGRDHRGEQRRVDPRETSVDLEVESEYGDKSSDHNGGAQHRGDEKTSRPEFADRAEDGPCQQVPEQVVVFEVSEVAGENPPGLGRRQAVPLELQGLGGARDACDREHDQSQAEGDGGQSGCPPSQ